MRANLAILFTEPLAKTPELIEWVVKQNLTAYYVPSPLVFIDLLNNQGHLIFGELHGSRKERLQGPDWFENIKTNMALVVVLWTQFDLVFVDSPFGKCYILSAMATPTPNNPIGLLDDISDKLKNDSDKRYFDIACHVKQNVNALPQLMGIIGIDVSPTHIVTVWEQEYLDNQQPKMSMVTSWHDEEGRAVDPPGTSLPATPAAKWRVNGEEDPFGIQYDVERAKLPKGDLTDDELANAMFCCNHRVDLDSIVWLTAGKDRIRWLSRALVKAQERIAELENNNKE